MDLITNSYVVELALTVGKIMLVVGPLLIAVAYLTLAERRVIGFMQLRKGPNVVGPFGMFQPFADALKLMVKETILPAGANKAVFILAPMLTFILALVAWAVIPFGEGLVIADINVGILYLFAISSLGVYGVIMAGWASNSKYAFLGALRSAAQMVSYEVSMEHSQSLRYFFECLTVLFLLDQTFQVHRLQSLQDLPFLSRNFL